MNTKNIVISALVVVALVFGVLAFKSPSVIEVPTSLKVDATAFGSKAPVVNVPAPIVNVAAPNITVHVPDAPKFGSVTGPDLPSPYFQFGGVRTWQYKTSMARAASTTCAIQSPVSSTTLVAATANMTTVASTTVFEIAYSTSAFASTTNIAYGTLTASTPATIIATSAPTGLNLASLTPPGVVPPNTYITFKIGGGSMPGTSDPVGQCIAVFREVQ